MRTSRLWKKLKAEQRKEQMRWDAVVEFDRDAPNGNIFAVLGAAKREMRKQQRIADYNEMWERVQKSEDYNTALRIIGEYVTLIDTTSYNKQM